MRCTLNISVGAVTLNIFAPRLSLLFFLLCFLSRAPSAFISPLSCFLFCLRVVISSILLTPAVIIPSPYIIPTILFYFLLPVISFLFFCRGIPGACTNTHAHHEAGLRCRFSIPVFTWEQTTSLHGLLPFLLPPPCWHKELMEYK